MILVHHHCQHLCQVPLFLYCPGARWCLVRTGRAKQIAPPGRNRADDHRSRIIRRKRNFRPKVRRWTPTWAGKHIPIGSMLLLYMANIYHQYTPNVSIYIPYMDPMGYKHEQLKWGRWLILMGMEPTRLNKFGHILGSHDLVGEVLMIYD